MWVTSLVWAYRRRFWSEHIDVLSFSIWTSPSCCLYLFWKKFFHSLNEWCEYQAWCPIKSEHICHVDVLSFSIWTFSYRCLMPQNILKSVQNTGFAKWDKMCRTKQMSRIWNRRTKRNRTTIIKATASNFRASSLFSSKFRMNHLFLSTPRLLLFLILSVPTTCSSLRLLSHSLPISFPFLSASRRYCVTRGRCLKPVSRSISARRSPFSSQ